MPYGFYGRGDALERLKEFASGVAGTFPYVFPQYHLAKKYEQRHGLLQDLTPAFEAVTRPHARYIETARDYPSPLPPEDETSLEWLKREASERFRRDAAATAALGKSALRAPYDIAETAARRAHFWKPKEERQRIGEEMQRYGDRIFGKRGEPYFDVSKRAFAEGSKGLFGERLGGLMERHPGVPAFGLEILGDPLNLVPGVGASARSTKAGLKALSRAPQAIVDTPGVLRQVGSKIKHKIAVDRAVIGAYKQTDMYRHLKVPPADRVESISATLKGIGSNREALRKSDEFWRLFPQEQGQRILDALPDKWDPGTVHTLTGKQQREAMRTTAWEGLPETPDRLNVDAIVNREPGHAHPVMVFKRRIKEGPALDKLRAAGYKPITVNDSQTYGGRRVHALFREADVLAARRHLTELQNLHSTDAKGMVQEMLNVAEPESLFLKELSPEYLLKHPFKLRLMHEGKVLKESRVTLADEIPVERTKLYEFGERLKVDPDARAELPGELGEKYKGIDLTDAKLTIEQVKPKAQRVSVPNTVTRGIIEDLMRWGMDEDAARQILWDSLESDAARDKAVERAKDFLKKQAPEVDAATEAKLDAIDNETIAKLEDLGMPKTMAKSQHAKFERGATPKRMAREGAKLLQRKARKEAETELRQALTYHQKQLSVEARKLAKEVQELPGRRPGIQEAHTRFRRVDRPRTRVVQPRGARGRLLKKRTVPIPAEETRQAERRLFVGDKEANRAVSDVLTRTQRQTEKAILAGRGPVRSENMKAWHAFSGPLRDRIKQARAEFMATAKKHGIPPDRAEAAFQRMLNEVGTNVTGSGKMHLTAPRQGAARATKGIETRKAEQLHDAYKQAHKRNKEVKDAAVKHRDDSIDGAVARLSREGTAGGQLRYSREAPVLRAITGLGDEATMLEHAASAGYWTPPLDAFDADGAIMVPSFNNVADLTTPFVSGWYTRTFDLPGLEGSVIKSFITKTFRSMGAGILGGQGAHGKVMFAKHMAARLQMDKMRRYFGDRFKKLLTSVNEQDREFGMLLRELNTERIHQLPGGPEWIANYANNKPAQNFVAELKSITDDIAEYVGLPKGKTNHFYVAHVFDPKKKRAALKQYKKDIEEAYKNGTEYTRLDGSTTKIQDKSKMLDEKQRVAAMFGTPWNPLNLASRRTASKMDQEWRHALERSGDETMYKYLQEDPALTWEAYIQSAVRQKYMKDVAPAWDQFLKSAPKAEQKGWRKLRSAMATGDGDTAVEEIVNMLSANGELFPAEWLADQAAGKIRDYMRFLRGFTFMRLVATNVSSLMINATQPFINNTMVIGPEYYLYGMTGSHRVSKKMAGLIDTPLFSIDEGLQWLKESGRLDVGRYHAMNDDFAEAIRRISEGKKLDQGRVMDTLTWAYTTTEAGNIKNTFLGGARKTARAIELYDEFSAKAAKMVDEAGMPRFEDSISKDLWVLEQMENAHAGHGMGHLRTSFMDGVLMPTRNDIIDWAKRVKRETSELDPDLRAIGDALGTDSAVSAKQAKMAAVPTQDKRQRQLFDAYTSTLETDDEFLKFGAKHLDVMRPLRENAARGLPFKKMLIQERGMQYVDNLQFMYSPENRTLMAANSEFGRLMLQFTDYPRQQFEMYLRLIGNPFKSKKAAKRMLTHFAMLYMLGGPYSIPFIADIAQNNETVRMWLEDMMYRDSKNPGDGARNNLGAPTNIAAALGIRLGPRIAVNWWGPQTGKEGDILSTLGSLGGTAGVTLGADPARFAYNAIRAWVHAKDAPTHEAKVARMEDFFLGQKDAESKGMRTAIKRDSWEGRQLVRAAPVINKILGAVSPYVQALAGIRVEKDYVTAPGPRFLRTAIGAAGGNLERAATKPHPKGFLPTNAGTRPGLPVAGPEFLHGTVPGRAIGFSPTSRYEAQAIGIKKMRAGLDAEIKGKKIRAAASEMPPHVTAAIMQAEEGGPMLTEAQIIGEIKAQKNPLMVQVISSLPTSIRREVTKEFGVIRTMQEHIDKAKEQKEWLMAANIEHKLMSYSDGMHDKMMMELMARAPRLNNTELRQQQDEISNSHVEIAANTGNKDYIAEVGRKYNRGNTWLNMARKVWQPSKTNQRLTNILDHSDDPIQSATYWVNSARSSRERASRRAKAMVFLAARGIDPSAVYTMQLQP
jgi:hypothetical protein